MNDLTNAAAAAKPAVKNYFVQVWADLKNNSWKTNVTLGVVVFVLAIT